MDGCEVCDLRQRGEKGSPAWLPWTVWLLVTAGVCWCIHATWHEAAQSALDNNALALGLGAEPAVSRWLPAAAALASLAVAVGQALTGGEPFRSLATAGASVGMKALAFGIEALLRA